MRKGGGIAKSGGVNIKQVAEAAGVSVATISRAFKKPDHLTPKTLKHVRAVIADMGYVPNAQARNLRTARTGLVIALVPDISNAFFAAIIRGIEKVAYENGYNVLLGDTQNDPSRERAYAQLVAARQADGLITLMPRRPDLEWPGRLPVVNASSYVDDDSITRVHVDNVAAAREATGVLIAMGHRRIGLISGTLTSPVFADREQGYRAALAEGGIDVIDAWVTAGDLSVEAGIAATELLFSRDPQLSAIFCANDEMALGAIKAVRTLGLRVPEDVSIIGFDDTPLARFFDPPLTTVAQPSMQMGEEAMRLLLEILADSSTPPRRRILSTQLVMRGSTAKNSRQLRQGEIRS